MNSGARVSPSRRSLLTIDVSPLGKLDLRLRQHNVLAAWLQNQRFTRRQDQRINLPHPHHAILLNTFVYFTFLSHIS